jgi:hypothetical protein
MEKDIKIEYLENRLYNAEKLVYDIFTNPNVVPFDDEYKKRMREVLAPTEHILEWQKERLKKELK